jgi:Flp pilus assembly protein TadD
LRPEYAEARYNLGNTLAGAGRRGEAEDAFREALRLKPDSADIAANLGVVQERRGRPAEAAASYRRALRIEPGNFVAGAGLARLGMSPASREGVR